MKTIKRLINIIPWAVTLWFACGSCNEDKSNKDDIFLKNVTSSTCDENKKSSNVDNSLFQDYITCTALDNKTLKIEQQILVACCSEESDYIDIKINSVDDTITINIVDKNTDCNCICSIVVGYEIVNLKENNTYKFIVQKNSSEYHTCELFFTSQVEGEVLL